MPLKNGKAGGENAEIPFSVEEMDGIHDYCDLALWKTKQYSELKHRTPSFKSRYFLKDPKTSILRVFKQT